MTSTVKGSVTAVGRRGAVVAVEKSMTYRLVQLTKGLFWHCYSDISVLIIFSATLGAKAAITGVKLSGKAAILGKICSLPNISAAICSGLARKGAIKLFGTENYAAQNLAAFGGI